MGGSPARVSRSGLGQAGATGVSNGVEDCPLIGVRPLKATGSGGGSDRVPGVLILELLRAQIADHLACPGIEDDRDVDETGGIAI